MVLLFDVGGVLVDLDLDLTLAGFDQIGIDLRPYLDSARQAGFLSDYESGKINTETMLSKMRALSTKSDLTDDEIAAAWCRLLVRLPQERLELILKARRHYRIALLSNTNPLSWGKARTEFIEQQGHTVSSSTKLFSRLRWAWRSLRRRFSKRPSKRSIVGPRRSSFLMMRPLIAKPRVEKDCAPSIRRPTAVGCNFSTTPVA